MEAEGAPTSSRWVRWLKVVAVLAVLGVLLWGTAPLVVKFAQWVENLGAIGAIVFVAGYVLLTVAMVPGSFLTLAAGAIFDWMGVVYTFSAAIVGAALAFLVSRYFLRSRIEKKFTGDARFKTIDKAIGRQGLKIAILLRLSPVFPFNLLNYAFGLTKIRFLHYNIASLAMIPGTFLYVYYGKVVGDVSKLAEGDSAEKGPEYYVVLGVGLLATIAVTTVITRIARKALKEATEDKSDAKE